MCVVVREYDSTLITYRDNEKNKHNNDILIAFQVGYLKSRERSDMTLTFDGIKFRVRVPLQMNSLPCCCLAPENIMLKKNRAQVDITLALVV